MEENTQELENNENDNGKDSISKNIESIRYTSQLSKELLESQIETFRSLNNKAGVILNILALFIPVYLFIIDHSNALIKCFSVIVILLLIFGIVSMFIVLNVYTLHIGVKEDKYADFINMSEEEIFLYEIAANKASIQTNDTDVLKKQNNWYKRGTKSVVFSVIFATILLTFSIFNKEEKSVMANKEKETKTPSDKSKEEKRVELPQVTKSELRQIKNLDTKTDGQSKNNLQK